MFLHTCPFFLSNYINVHDQNNYNTHENNGSSHTIDVPKWPYVLWRELFKMIYLV